ncbi:MAG TPA: hypothetical protein VMS09_08180 [Paenibacillus sp.]|uniref:hypothetical protein n=1 Tax=Paenibacillus sp. TaxID=58172 RepID=UPI0028D437C2|nr:hypothetical protein [Paenibacillus sp.]HUC91991.1 hypothetical protein [Paenibacillus sp.]
MATKLEQLHSATIRIAEHGVDGDAEEWNSLLALRDEALEELTALSALTGAQEQMVREISAYDSVLVEQMELLKEQAAASLEKLNQSKLQKNVYEQSYAAGSYFIDKRK